MTVEDMINTFDRWIHEPLDETTKIEAVSDSIISIWETLVQINLSSMLGGPVTFTLAKDSGIAQLPADGTTPAADIWYISSLSVKTDQGEKFWSETEVGSVLWKYYTNSKAANTPYQPYVFDLLSGGRIDVRPLTAADANPTYFYVAKPNPITDKTKAIPFSEPGAILFIRYNAISLLKLGFDEFQSASEWRKRAEDQRLSLAQAANVKNHRKNETVRPYIRG